MRTRSLLGVILTLLATLAATAMATPASADTARHCVLGSDGETQCYSSEAAARSAEEALYLILVVYDDINYNGDTDAAFYSSTPCTAAYDDEQNKKFSNLGPMDNDITSWQTIGNCRVRFYDGAGFGRPMTALSYVGVDCPDMRTCFGSTNWNNRASSLALT